MKTNNNNNTEDFYFNLIVNNINLSEYNLNDATINEKIVHTYNIFYRDKLYAIPLYGVDEAFEMWIKSNDSVFTFPMDADQVIQLAIKEGYIQDNAEEDTIDNLLSTYFMEIRLQFMSMYYVLEEDLSKLN